MPTSGAVDQIHGVGPGSRFELHGPPQYPCLIASEINIQLKPTDKIVSPRNLGLSPRKSSVCILICLKCLDNKAWNGQLAICHHEALDLEKDTHTCRCIRAYVHMHTHVHIYAHMHVHTD